MKNITINKSDRKQISKCVLLGNGKRMQFGSNRAAGYFVAETNRFLTKTMVVLNDIMIELFREYRQAWFVTTNSHHGKQINKVSIQARLQSDLRAAESQLDKFTFSNYGSNDPSFAFIDLQKTAIFLQDAANILVEFHKTKNATIGMYCCQMLHDRCSSVILRLSEYGGENNAADPAG